MQPNIILLVLDTLRKDHIFPYSRSLKQENIMKLIRDSVVYDNSYSTSSWTLPAHASLFLGRYVSEHRFHSKKDLTTPIDFVEDTRERLLDPFTEFLKKEGYHTYGLSANPFISSYSGFSKGFDVFIDAPILDQPPDFSLNSIVEKWVRGKINNGWDFLQKSFQSILSYTINYGKIARTCDVVVNNKGGKELIDVLTNNTLNSPFFLFINLMEMHEPYIRNEIAGLLRKDHLTDYYSPLKFTAYQKLRIIKRYGKQGHIIDQLIGRVLHFLKDKGIYENSLIIVLSDHGQSLWEQGYYGHGIFLYDHLVEIPLIIKYPYNWKPGKKGDSFYHSIIDIRELIEKWAESEKAELKSRTEVFAESYGINTVLKPTYFFIDKKKLQMALLYRKAIFTRQKKLTLNSKFEFEDEYKYNRPIKVDRKDPVTGSMKDMIVELANSDPYFSGSL